MHLKRTRFLPFLLAGVLLLSLTGCKKPIPKPDFETAVFENDVCEFEIPAGWEEHKESSVSRQILLVPENSDFSRSVSSIHVNLSQSGKKKTTLKEMEKTFRKNYEKTVLEVAPGACSFSYSSWDAPNYEVFKAEYDVLSPSGAKAHITQYYPLMDQKVLVVTATDAEEGVSVNVSKAAEHIINTFQLK